VDIRIIVAAHKAYPMPDDPLYLPVQAGRALHDPLPYTGDDTGDSISRKNPYYCELTCMYWAWKNLPADYIGLCHYRRYFRRGLSGNKWSRILSGPSAEALLRDTPVLLPKKRHYVIETNYSQYIHAHHREDLETTRAILAREHPAYLPFYDASMNRRSGHRFNMLVMRRDLFDAYCQWLFSVLSALEAQLDITSYSDRDKRVFGYVGERLLDVWVDANRIPYRELPVIHMESQHWLTKGAAFLRRKLFSRRSS